MSTRAVIGEGKGTPLQCSCLENPMDGGAWWAAVHGVVKSRTWLSDFTFTFHFHALEKEMPPHSSALAWKIPWTEEPGGLPSMGSLRVGHDWSDLAAAAAAAAGLSCKAQWLLLPFLCDVSECTLRLLSQGKQYLFLFLFFLYEMMSVNKTYHGNNFMTSINKSLCCIP